MTTTIERTKACKNSDKTDQQIPSPKDKKRIMLMWIRKHTQSNSLPMMSN